ncbi:MAG: AMP-binding protein [Dermatophilaceae bacterium]
MAGPPRIFEKVHGRILQTMAETGGIRSRLFTWGFEVGARAAAARADGRPVGRLLSLQLALADRLVLAKVRDRLGGRMRFMISGSPALSPDIANWFQSAGLTLIEGYALTETGGGACIGDPQDPVAGVVGPPLVGSELGIADDGEILLRGPHVMRGYHNLPEETARVLSPDGWFFTGDIGELDGQGRLRVTDRKKDLIKTSGGKYIARSRSRPSSRRCAHSRARSLCTPSGGTMPPRWSLWTSTPCRSGVAPGDLTSATSPGWPQIRRCVPTLAPASNSSTNS